MPALASARTWAGYAAAYCPSLKTVARNPFCRKALSRLGVCALDGPSSKVNPTYPLHVAACDGVAVRATVPVRVTAVTATAASSERFGRRDVSGMGCVLFWCWCVSVKCASGGVCRVQLTVMLEFPLLW